MSLLPEAELMHRAADLSGPMIRSMARALGWPARQGMTRWGDPDRNFSDSPKTDAVWCAAARLGYAQVSGEGWQVTELGQLVLRCRLVVVQALHGKIWKQALNSIP